MLQAAVSAEETVGCGLCCHGQQWYLHFGSTFMSFGFVLLPIRLAHFVRDLYLSNVFGQTKNQ